MDSSHSGFRTVNGTQGLRQRGQIPVRILPVRQELAIQLLRSRGIVLERRGPRQSEFGQRIQGRDGILPPMIQNFAKFCSRFTRTFKM
jgi:hypothetical protein